MATKLKKSKKQMSPRTRNVITNSFKGIISNQACVDNGREAPWWLAIIFFLFALIIPLIPNHVSLNKAYGASFLSNGTYGLAENLSRATVRLKQEGKKKLIKSEATLFYENDGVLLTDEYTTVEVYSNDNSYGEYDFKIYYSTCMGNSLSAEVSRLQNTFYVRGSLNEVDWEQYWATPVLERPQLYVPNFMILSRYTMGVALYKKASGVYGSTVVGAVSLSGLRWNELADGELISHAASVIQNADSIDPDLIPNQDTVRAFTYWTDVFNATYEYQKNSKKWNTTLIYLGVYGGLMIFLGLMVYLLTRGKNNPYRVLNLWVTQKTAYFLSFTPALLAMIFGFIFGGNMLGQMAFIMLISLRVMWASMRTLRPVQ